MQYCFTSYCLDYELIAKPIRYFLKSCFSFIYPSFCRSCNFFIPQGYIFCNDCLKRIKPTTSLDLYITQKYSVKVFAVSNYKEPVKSLILKKVFCDQLASIQLSELIFKNINIQRLNIDYIIPIPLHWTRYALRGYNQSFIMAKFLSKKLNISCLNILKRKKRTSFQSKLSFDKRQVNVKDAFDLNLKYKFKDMEFLKNKNILLIDDLCTTGATLKSASKILINFKPKSIIAVVACRVI